MTNDGGQAFPGAETDCLGLTARDYFAAHAPAEPLWEFDVKMPSPRPASGKLGRDGYPVNWAEITEWDENRNRERAIQWPWVWADAMLENRG